MDPSLRRLLLRVRSALHGCLHESELDLDRPERAAVLARRIADIDTVLAGEPAVETGCSTSPPLHAEGA